MAVDSDASEVIDYAALMRELLSLWDKQMRSEIYELQVEVSHQSVPVIVHGLAAHTAESARAVSLLYQAGTTVASLPLIRSMLEDVMTIDYVLREPEGWKRRELGPLCGSAPQSSIPLRCCDQLEIHSAAIGKPSQ